jgi:hypothetical protein
LLLKIRTSTGNRGREQVRPEGEATGEAIVLNINIKIQTKKITGKRQR